MKRGKDDDKTRGPMFPRLHVNDTEKGGPRAPPRNKMALYEQLSIPSQRFNPGVVPRVSNNASNLVPPGSSSQGSGLERNVLYPYYVPPSAPTHVAEKLHSHRPDRGNSNTSLAQPVQQKKVGDEDDFTVPVFVHSGKSQNHIKMQTSTDQEKLVTLSPIYPSRSSKPQNDGVNYPKHIGSTGLNLRKDRRNQSKENSEAHVSSSNHISRSSTNLPAREDISRPEGANSSHDQQYGDNPMSNFTRLLENDVCLQQGLAARLQSNLCAYGESVPELTEEIEKSTNPLHGSDSCSRKDCSSLNEPEIDSECCGDKTYRSLQFKNGDKSNDASEASMVDSISALEISPDDVVGIIGQKHFWKARRAIATQQRVFAVQVFELHRLLKVQQLIAGSPHLLLEDAAQLGKHSAKISPSEKLPSECVVAPPVHVTKRKGNAENPNHKMECSAENAVGRTSFSSVKNSQLANYGPYTGSPIATSVATDAKMGPQCFYPSLGQQWLIPVMSPSEGLIYKPYSASGFMGSGCGGYGTFGPIPLPGNFMNSAYGVPASHHQGIGALPVAPPVGHGYFPPYGMPVMNPAMSGSVVDQMNYFAGSGSQGQTAQHPEGRLNSNMQHQSSCIEPTQKSEAVPQGAKLQASKDSERQGSTGSSPSGRVQGDGNAQTPEGRDAFSLFPTAPPASEGFPQLPETRVIKVVPRNARSATESAARIFQSIQEERKQYDST